ncbi:Co-chaperone Hsc20 [Aspergillus heteromorphus CBS 117.55]|uniref:Co-chaperone Hsc20 n=1 Tax=Aspergillus heteromorphus CBS 117.55 TaxID=1448321 RepID=A0A317WSI5_9EURO|nr:Co-chaperone Hsc20 [Aspergillus heteromorphus CBS 117.55]PWY89339.1 Co-chaperone Hsc20 [Aspergillus heteromorphus CBS 117.55]
MATSRLAARLRAARSLQPGPRVSLPTSTSSTSTYLRSHLRSPITAASRTPPLSTHRFASTKPPSSADTTESHPATPLVTPDITNHYTIFKKTLPAGPPPASPFDISMGDLRREFLQWQSLIHPDKYPSGPQKHQAEALSARINEAYRTLLDPLPRAQYLLREMHGIDVLAEDGASKHALDPATLMEVMEVQETIEEVGADPGAEGTIAELKKENDARVEGCVRALAAAFDAGDVETARQECVRLRFWYSVGEGLREWEPGTTEIRLVH